MNRIETVFIFKTLQKLLKHKDLEAIEEIVNAVLAEAQTKPEKESGKETEQQE